MNPNGDKLSGIRTTDTRGRPALGSSGVILNYEDIVMIEGRSRWWKSRTFHLHRFSTT
jgi:hypothetical protein